MSRIMIVAHGLDNGGAERVASIVANGFAEAGHVVQFVAVYSDKKTYRLQERVEYKYIEIHAHNSLERLAQRSVSLLAYVKEKKPDVIISFIINEMCLCSCFLRTPIIYSLRNDPNHLLHSPFNRLICQYLYRRAARVVFQTKGAQSYFSETIRNKSVVIPNPLVNELPHWSFENCEKIIITACRLNKQKNIPMLLTAFKRFNEMHNSEFRLVICGKGELQEEMQQLADSLEISKHVTFLGYVQNVHEMMQKSFQFVMTSDYEGLSNSMLEALAIGVPSVITDSQPGGAREYIVSGQNGYLCPVGDTETFSERMGQLADSPETMCRFSQNSVTIRDALSEHRVIAAWLDTINEVIKNK